MLPVDELLPPISSESTILSGATAPIQGLWKKIVGGITLILASVFAILWFVTMFTPVPIPEHTIALVSSHGFHAGSFFFPTIVGAARGEDGSWNTFTLSPRWASLASFEIYYAKRQTHGLIQIESDQSWTTSTERVRLIQAYRWSGWRFWSQTRGELRVAEITGTEERPIVFRGSVTKRLLESSTPIEDVAKTELVSADISAQGAAFSFIHLVPVCNSLRIPIEIAALNPTSTTLAINQPCSADESWTLRTTDKEFASVIRTQLLRTLLPKRQTIQLEDTSLAVEKLLGERLATSSTIAIGSSLLRFSEHQATWAPASASSTKATPPETTTSCGLEHPILALSKTALHNLLPAVPVITPGNELVVGSHKGHLSICWTE